MEKENLTKKKGSSSIVIAILVVLLITVSIVAVIFINKDLNNNKNNNNSDETTTAEPKSEIVNNDESIKTGGYLFSADINKYYDRIKTDENGEVLNKNEIGAINLKYDKYNYNGKDYKVEFKGELSEDGEYAGAIKGDLLVNGEKVTWLNTRYFRIDFINEYLIIEPNSESNNMDEISIIDMNTNKLVEKFYFRNLIDGHKSYIYEENKDYDVENDSIAALIKDNKIVYYYIGENCKLSTEKYVLIGHIYDVKTKKIEISYEKIMDDTSIVGESTCSQD